VTSLSDAKFDVTRAHVDPTRKKADVRALIKSYYLSGHTDDYPSVTVTVTLAGGRTLHAGSKAQQAFMIPWLVDGEETWEPGLGRAVAALLPAGAENKDRMSGKHFVGELQDLLDLQRRYP